MSNTEALRKLAAEYRPTMPADVLRLWAADVAAALAQQSAAPVAPAPLSERDMLRMVASATTRANAFSDDGTTQEPTARQEPGQ